MWSIGGRFKGTIVFNSFQFSAYAEEQKTKNKGDITSTLMWKQKRKTGTVESCGKRWSLSTKHSGQCKSDNMSGRLLGSENFEREEKKTSKKVDEKQPRRLSQRQSDPFRTQTSRAHSNHNQIALAVKAGLLYTPYQKWQQIPKAFGEKETWDRNEAKHSLKSRWLQAVFTTAKTRFPYEIFPNTKTTAPLRVDSLGNRSVNSVGHGASSSHSISKICGPSRGLSSRVWWWFYINSSLTC